MIRERYIPEDPANPFRLGRHVLHDDASRNYRAPLAPQVSDVAWPSNGLPLNQGRLGKCTAEALVGRLDSDPPLPYAAAQERLFTDADADILYGRETADEGSPWPPNDPGGSGLAVCKAAKELGWLTSYTHTFSFGDMLKALALRPVMLGTSWWSSMFEPDASGVVTISPGATLAGGHEYLADQILVEQQLVGCWNSWGPAFGIGGRFYLPWATLERLLADDGDCTVPMS